MSLINDVLRDLEQRRPRPAEPLGRVRVVPGRAAASVTWLLPGAVALLLLAGGLWWWLGAAGTAGTAAQQAAPIDLALPVPTPVVAAPPAGLVGIAYRSDAARMRWELALQGQTVPEARYDRERRQLLLQLPGAELAAELPAAALDEGRFESIALRQDEEGVTLALQLSQPVRVRSSLQSGGEGGRYLLELLVEAEALPPPIATTEPAPLRVMAQAPQTAVAPPPEQGFRRAPSAPDPQAEAEREYRIALESLRLRRVGATIERLQQVLTLDEAHHAARELLVSLYLEQGRLSAAQQELARAVGQWPQQAGYAQVYGRLLLEQGEPAAAVAVLEAARPRELADGAYHALLAAAYQRSERFNEAQAVYAELVRLEPRRALWWFGLGAAADAAGDREQALLGYRRALSVDGLEASLDGFARDRVRQLGQGS